MAEYCSKKTRLFSGLEITKFIWNLFSIQWQKMILTNYSYKITKKYIWADECIFVNNTNKNKKICGHRDEG